MADTKLVMLCAHCGKQAVFEVRAEGTKYGASLSQALIDYEGTTLTTWRILECASCREPTLEQSIIDYKFETDPIVGTREAVSTSAEKKILHPGAKITKRLTNLPATIEREYEDTLKVREISSVAAAVLARRTLEAIFIHENAEGKTLMEKVNSLLKSDRIPPLLADMAHVGRKIGNLGAHFAEEKVTEEDVTALLDFVEAILEYLYVAPAKVAAIKARFAKTS